MVAEAQPRRGDVWWALADKRRPVVVVQADFLNRSRTAWILAVPLTTQLHRADAPGNVRIAARESGLSRASVVVVTQVAALPRSGFRERVAALEPRLVEQIEDGLRLVLDLERAPG